MDIFINYIMILIIIINFYILGTSRFRSLLRSTATQGAILGMLPILLNSEKIMLPFIIIAIITISLKGFLFPISLTRVKRKINVYSEIEPYVGFVFSILFGIIAIGISIWLCLKLSIFTNSFDLKLMTSIFTIFIGLFVIISRKKAITQIIGYLIMENGISLLAISMVGEIPLLIEFGILLDVFIAVFIMGIAAYHINNEFEHIDIDKLNTLKG